ncbi:hypothetical protein GCM10007968_27190 [Sporolactobacillus putidus]|uniref:Uncharacterized protein n=1 Tax=Sporolactobacillus putidus TaxID=492735 RepID=A0A917S6S9_9BACL|nr:hypothetical protein GCM10007968_27190 [Sporolactobacillus putidus]
MTMMLILRMLVLIHLAYSFIMKRFKEDVHVNLVVFTVNKSVFSTFCYNYFAFITFW